MAKKQPDNHTIQEDGISAGKPAHGSDANQTKGN